MDSGPSQQDQQFEAQQQKEEEQQQAAVKASNLDLQKRKLAALRRSLGNNGSNLFDTLGGQ